jgi:hypothetical protein
MDTISKDRPIPGYEYLRFYKIASEEGDLNTVKIVLDKFDLDTMDKEASFSIYCTICVNRYYEIANLICDKYPNYPKLDSNLVKFMDLWLKCRANGIFIKEWLDNFYYEDDNNTIEDIFILACVTCKTTIADVILSHYSIDITHWDSYEKIFTIACSDSNLKVVKWLVNKNPNVDLDYDQCFRLACEHGRLKIAQYLVEIAERINIYSERNYSFKKACQNGHVNVIDWFLNTHQQPIKSSTQEVHANYINKINAFILCAPKPRNTQAIEWVSREINRSSFCSDAERFCTNRQLANKIYRYQSVSLLDAVIKYIPIFDIHHNNDFLFLQHYDCSARTLEDKIMEYCNTNGNCYYIERRPRGDSTKYVIDNRKIHGMKYVKIKDVGVAYVGELNTKFVLEEI